MGESLPSFSLVEFLDRVFLLWRSRRREAKEKTLLAPPLFFTLRERFCSVLSLSLSLSFPWDSPAEQDPLLLLALARWSSSRASWGEKKTRVRRAFSKRREELESARHRRLFFFFDALAGFSKTHFFSSHLLPPTLFSQFTAATRQRGPRDSQSQRSGGGSRLRR